MKRGQEKKQIWKQEAGTQDTHDRGLTIWHDKVFHLKRMSKSHLTRVLYISPSKPSLICLILHLSHMQLSEEIFVACVPLNISFYLDLTIFFIAQPFSLSVPD